MKKTKEQRKAIESNNVINDNQKRVKNKFRVYKKKNVVYVNEEGIEFTKSDVEDLGYVRRLQNGDGKAFSPIYNKYYKLILYKLIYSLRCDTEVAEDITMDIFEKLYVNIGKYQPSYTFNAWLSAISRNCLIDFVRKNKNSRHNISLDKTFNVSNDDGFEVTIQIHSPSLNPEQQMISKNGIEVVNSIVKKMKSDYQILFKLRYIDQVSYDDMRVQTGMSVAKIKIDLYRIRQLLIDSLKKLNMYEGFKENQLGSNEDMNIISKRVYKSDFSKNKNRNNNVLEMA